MGRGRAKAKQTKVARELKYQSPKTDLDALQRELAGNGKPDPDDPYAHDPYADYRDDADEDDEEASWSSQR
jgi:hypothetical protein